MQWWSNQLNSFNTIQGWYLLGFLVWNQYLQLHHHASIRHNKTPAGVFVMWAIWSTSSMSLIVWPHKYVFGEVLEQCECCMSPPRKIVMTDVKEQPVMWRTLNLTLQQQLCHRQLTAALESGLMWICLLRTEGYQEQKKDSLHDSLQVPRL